MLPRFFLGSAKWWADGKQPDPSDTPERFVRGPEVWVVQTYLEMMGAGIRVGTENDPSDSGPLIVHYQDLRNPLVTLRNCLILVQADRPHSPLPVLRVLQSEASRVNAGDIVLPHWPQPGLVRRAAHRAGRLEVAAYFGRKPIPEFLTDSSFQERLTSLGVAFRHEEHRWWDYSDVDVVIAIRSGEPALERYKPVSKLVNAWIAGAIPIVGPELPYRQTQQSPLDFIEAADGEDVLRAISRLKSAPAEAEARRAHGALRAPAFDRPAVREHWISAIDGPFEDTFRRWELRRHDRARRALDLASLGKTTASHLLERRRFLKAVGWR